MYITIRVTGDKHWVRTAHYAARNLGNIAIKPELTRLGNKLMTTLRALFAPSSGGAAKGKTFKHGHTGEYGQALRLTVNNSELVIHEGITQGGENILFGTKPVSKRDQHGNPVIPRRVVEWAESKLGVPRNEAFAIARSIAAHGIGWSGGKSPLQREPPTGEGRMEFPLWVLEKNKQAIDSAAERIGGLTVQYLDK